MSDWVMSDHCLSDWSCQTTASQMEDRLHWLGRTQVQYDTNVGDNASGQLATRQETKWILDLGICIFVFVTYRTMAIIDTFRDGLGCGSLYNLLRLHIKC